MAMIPTRHEVTGHEAEFPEDVIAAWRGLGWIPISELDKRDDATETPAPAGPAPTQNKPARTRAASTEEPTP